MLTVIDFAGHLRSSTALIAEKKSRYKLTAIETSCWKTKSAGVREVLGALAHKMRRRLDKVKHLRYYKIHSAINRETRRHEQPR